MSEESEVIRGPIGATSRLLGLLPQLASILVVVSAVGYWIGWKIARTYYDELGAPWVTEMLSPSQLAQGATAWMTAFASVWLGSIFALHQRTATTRGLKWTSIALLAIASLMSLLSILFKQEAGILAIVGGLFWIFGLALTAGELVGQLVDANERWDNNSLYLAYFLFAFGLSWFPYEIGHANAVSDTSGSSNLPTVMVSSPGDQGPWLLVAPVNGKLLLMKLENGTSPRQFRVIDPVSATAILYKPH
jgi:hypothetical protein